jgi:hypothetical protein
LKLGLAKQESLSRSVVEKEEVRMKAAVPARGQEGVGSYQGEVCFHRLDFQSKNISYAIFIVKKWPLYVNFSIPP